MPYLKKLFSDANFVKAPLYVKYGVPVLLTALATLIKIWLNSYIGYKTPFLLYFGVVIVTSRYFGKWPAIVVTIISAILVNLFFLYPFNSLHITKEAVIQVGIFILECILLIKLSEALNKAVTILNDKDVVFRTLVEKSSEGIITVNANGNITYCSPSVQNIIGYTDEEFKALPAWYLLHPDEALEVKEQYYRYASHPGKHIIMTHRMRHKSGEYIWIESKMSNMLGEQPINATIANFTDITDRILDDKLREDFISIASHELKTPLTSLKAYTQVLQARFKHSTDETSLNIVNKIEAQVSKVVQMVSNLLDVTSLQQKKLSLNIRLFDLNEMVNEVAEAIQETSKNHRLTIDLAPITRVSGDRERLSQVVSNMITNAIKYSPDADEVIITSKIENNQVILSIQDKGIGIPVKDQQRIFARFYRVHDPLRNIQGLGLGLYICSQIIEHHGGNIGVESEPQKGSTFWFSLPLNSI